ncbi:MAG: efflux RND transporter periplasmic adaptor subunit [Acidobacteriota bacterium]|nr:efflux RND transporter periplasmic adaptor subunit [Acidobacteriota bacterium]
MRLSICVMLVLLTISCGKEEEQFEEIIRPVRTEEVAAGGGRRVRTFSGSARAGLESRLSFRVSGTIKSLKVKLGDRVKKGDIIAELDPTDYSLQVDDAEASLRQAQAQSRNAAATYERLRGLYENNNVSINDLDAARASMESAGAQVQSITKKLELARSQLSYTRLPVPLDGVIAQVNAEVNENVQAGQAIVTLNAGSRPETIFVVPEQLVSEIKPGDSVTVQFDAIPGKEFGATIIEVGVASGSFATTYPVTALLDDPNADVRQGMATEVSMIFGSSEDDSKIYVRPKAVIDGSFVYVVQPEAEGLAKVVKKPVTVGELTAQGMEIISGLTEGEQLIVAGTRFITEGMTVKLPKAKE